MNRLVALTLSLAACTHPVSVVDAAGADASADVPSSLDVNAGSDVPRDDAGPPGPLMVTGTLIDGATIRVAGSGFGDLGPTIEVFDDFERGADGDAITATSPAMGRWDLVNLTPRHSARYHHGDGLSARLDANSDPTHTAPSGTYYDILGVLFDAPTPDVFVADWRYLPEEDVIPGTGTVDGPNWKSIWVMGADTANDDDLFFGVPDDDGSGFSFPSVSGNDAIFDHAPTRYWSSLFRRGRWIREEIYVHAAADDTGQLFVWEIPWSPVADGYNSTGEMLRMNALGEPVLHGAGECRYPPCTVFERLNVNGYDRPTPNSHPTYDDVYVAVGPGARARVEIASAETWGDGAHAGDMNMTICTPTEWSSTSVACTVRRGSFEHGAAGYLFVVAADGTVSDVDPSREGMQGAPVRFGP